MRVILIPVTGRPECAQALEQGFSLADSCTANVIGCHLRPPRRREGPADRGNRILGMHRWAPVSQGLSEMEIEANRAAAEELFKRLAAKHNFDLIDQPELGAMRTARWVFMAGSVDSLFASHGRISDLTLVTRPQPDAKGIGGDFMLAALIESGKPVIVLPQSPANSLGKRILIAWNQSVEAARAVTASLPLLQQAESVYIVSAGPESKRGPKAASLASHLNYWNVNAVCRRTKGRDAAQGILDVFHKEGADLLVMGAYSRGRIRETVFGGVTEDLLMGSPLPVFALHS